MIFLLFTKVSFFDNLVKNLTVAEVLRKNIWFSLPVPKIKFDPPPQGKMLWCSYFRSFIKSINLDRCGNLIEKFNFVSTASKIIIPIAHHPPYHPLNTPSPMPLPTLPPPPPTSLTSTLHTPPPPSHHPHPPMEKKWGLNAQYFMGSSA